MEITLKFSYGIDNCTMKTAKTMIFHLLISKGQNLPLMEIVCSRRGEKKKVKNVERTSTINYRGSAKNARG